MKLVSKKLVSLLTVVGIISSLQLILSSNKSNALNNHEILSKSETLIEKTPEIKEEKLISQGVMPAGTLVSFLYTEGYPPVTTRYCGYIAYWNGGSYDIQVGTRRFYYIPEQAIVKGCY